MPLAPRSPRLMASQYTAQVLIIKRRHLCHTVEHFNTHASNSTPKTYCAAKMYENLAYFLTVSLVTRLWYSLESAQCMAQENQDYEICPTLFHFP